MLRAGHRHIEHSQVFRQPFPVRGGNIIIFWSLNQAHLTIYIVNFRNRGIPGRRLAEAANKRQKHQGIFQPLGLMDRYHPNQFSIYSTEPVNQ